MGKIVHQSVDNDLKIYSGIKSDLEELRLSLTDTVTQTNSDMRVILVSDMHLYAESQKNFTSDQRMQLMVDSINIEHEKKPIDFVLVVGDLSMNDDTLPTKDGVIDLKNNYLSQLKMPYYCMAGNHDMKTNADWKTIFGYEKNFTITLGNYVFICADTYNNTVTDGSGYTYSLIDSVWLSEQLNKFKDKSIFFFSHWFDAFVDVNALSLINNAPNILAMFEGHIHDDLVFNPPNCNKKTYRTGNFSYPKDYIWTTGQNWGFRNLEIRDGKMQTEMIYIAHAYNNFTDTIVYTSQYEVKNVVDLQTVPNVPIGTFNISPKEREKFLEKMVVGLQNNLKDSETNYTANLNKLSSFIPVYSGVDTPANTGTVIGNTYTRILNKPIVDKTKFTKLTLFSPAIGTMKLRVFKKTTATNFMLLSETQDLSLVVGENNITINLTLEKDQYIAVVGTGANSVFYSVEGSATEEVIIPASLTVGTEYSGGDGTKKIQFKLTGSVVF